MQSIPSAAERQLINVRVRAPGRKLQLNWQCGPDADEHAADAAAVEKAAGDVRAAFRRLVEVLHRPGWKAAVAQVAQNGARLYEELVPAHVSLRKRLDSAIPCDLRISIVDVCQASQLPWGGIYSGSLSQGARNLRDDFWCIKHNVFAYQETSAEDFNTGRETLRNRSHPIAYVPHSGPRPRGGSFCRHREEFEVACSDHRHSTWALYLREAPEVPEDILKVITAQGARLKSIPKDTLSASATGMLFIDGMDMQVDGRLGTRLLREVWEHWQGLIVSEVPIARELDFCVHLVEQVRGGRPVSELVRDVRAEYWPESLLYGVYCIPGFAFQPPPYESVRT